MKEPTPLQRFMALCEQDANGCWIWLSTLSEKGYPRFNYRRKRVRAHRWIYELIYGPLPDDIEVDHTCFVKRCVNPKHLEAVTGEENRKRYQQMRSNSK